MIDNHKWTVQCRFPHHMVVLNIQQAFASLYMYIAERFRAGRVHINHLKLSDLEQMKERHVCNRIEGYDQKVRAYFEVNTSCELRYKNELRGHIYKTDTGVVVGSKDCKSVYERRRVCSPCKKLRKLLQRLSLKDDNAPVPEPLPVPDPDTAELPLSEIRRRIQNPVCKWENCNSDKFMDIHELNYHVKTHIPPLLNLTPTERVYYCKWDGCKSKFIKHKLLLSHIKRCHSGKETAVHVY